MPGFPRRLLAAAALVALSLGAISSSYGYAFLGSHWFSPTIPTVVQLGPSDIPLADGSPSYDAVVENAMALWNEQIAGTQFTWTVVPPGSPAAMGNGVNDVLLSSKVYGDNFGAGVLAVTLTNASGSQTTETDVLFNNANAFNSYRGTAYAAGTIGFFDMHRIAIHELGHALGLDHPDDHGQTVDAIMNAHITTLDSLQADDIAGAVALYGAQVAAGAEGVLARLAVGAPAAARGRVER